MFFGRQYSVRTSLQGSRHNNRRNRRRLGIQSLEQRQLLAAEVIGAAPPSTLATESTTTALVSTSIAEGEPAPDLVEFAKQLSNAGVKFFSAAWCADCSDQAALFEDGRDDLPFIEVTGPDRQFNAVGIAEGVTVLPTWEFPDGSRFEGSLTLSEISTMSEVTIPVGETPSFAALGDETVLIGSPLHIPIDAYDPNGDPLTITVTVDDPTVVEAVVLSGNRSIRIDMEGFGDMVFQLYEQRAPVPSGRVIELAESGFYDGIIFHRVVDDFVLQAGDPTGTGESGSELGVFDDQFNPDLQHNRSGILSFAKSNDDTNNSQFFITEVEKRFLDFQHSIFGQLVEGDDVREAISEMEVIDPTAIPPNNRPVVDVVMTTIDVFTDTENGIIMLRAIGDAGTTTSVTVRLTDSTGLFSEQSFGVTVADDNANSQPYLEPLDVPAEVFVNQTLELQLTSIDIEGDLVFYDAALVGGDIDGTVVVDNATGAVTVTPAADAAGQLNIAVAVAPGIIDPETGEVGTDGSGNFDRQDFVINVVPPPPFHRFQNPPDVNGLDGITALDALVIINAMADNGGEIDLSEGGPEGLNSEFAYNVNGDDRITALDALLVINAIAAAGGETEQSQGVIQESSATPTEAFFASYAAVSPIVTPWLDDDREELIYLRARYELGLQTLD